jgi:antitoxin component of MazEF toxin-antitoxin module
MVNHIAGGPKMPFLTKRSLIKFGRDSCVITLPSAWLRYYDLKPGDKVTMIADGEIIIRPQSDEPSSSPTSKEVER